MVRVGELKLNCGICDEEISVDISAGLDTAPDGNMYVVTSSDLADLWMHYFVNHPEDCE